MCSRWVDEGHVGDGFGDEFAVVPGEVVHHGVGGVRGPATGSVGQKMIDGHVSDVLLVWGLAVFCAENARRTEDFVGKVELALFDQGEDGDGGDGHGDGRDAEEAGLLDLREMLAVAHADGLIVHELAVAGDGDGSGGNCRIAGGRRRQCGPSRLAADRWIPRIVVARGLLRWVRGWWLQQQM